MTASLVKPSDFCKAVSRRVGLVLVFLAVLFRGAAGDRKGTLGLSQSLQLLGDLGSAVKPLMPREAV